MLIVSLGKLADSRLQVGDAGEGTALLSGTGITNLGILSITNGVVTFGDAASAATVTDEFTALLTAMEASKSSAAFVAEGDTYIVQGDGVAGVQNSDILIKLSGVAVTGLRTIII